MIRSAITIIFSVLFIATYCEASIEGLDELALRKERLSLSTRDTTALEDATTYVWQPETLMYTDSITGNEVWRLTASNSTLNLLPDLNHSGWSADGKRFVFGSQRNTRAFTSTYEDEYEGIVMMMRADGSYLRTVTGGPFKVFVHSRYFTWSPVTPDIYYGFGRNYAGEGYDNDDLYKVTVGDLSLTEEKIFDLNTAGEATLAKSFSPDGTTLRAIGDDKYFFFSLSGNSISLTNPNGWVIGRQLDNYWGGTHTPADSNYTNHYSGVIGVGANKKLYFMPEGYNSVWSWELTGGTAADGGPEHIVDHEPPYDWGGIRPVVSGDSNGGVCATTNKTPWCCDGDPNTDCDRYFSHNTYDRWGRILLGVNAQVGDYWATWDLNTHKYINDKISTGSTAGWHTDWNAWSDYFATSYSSLPTKGLGGIWTAKYDGSDSKMVASGHLREAGSTSYDSLPRTTQSPDGTKLVFHSDFLRDIANTWDMFYAVAYYPHPPEITSVTDNSGVYTVRFDWRLGTATPRGYTKRGWPDEATNEPPPPRETKAFRLWRSSTGIGEWEPVATANADIFSRYNFQNGSWSGNNYWTIVDTPGEGVFYYAVTAIEHSGLESRTLSNVFSTNNAQTSFYPINPKIDSNFITSYRSSLVRAYNIFAQDGSTPAEGRATLIATVPTASGLSWIDWLGNTDGSTKYKVTAIDSQGNESPPLTTTYSPRIIPGQYDVSWTAEIAPEPTCDVNHANLCTQTQCATLTLYYWDGLCHSYPQPAVCDGSHLGLCTVGNCSSVGGFWYNETCNATAEIVCSPTHREKCVIGDCVSVGEGFWYDNACHAEAAPTPGARVRYRPAGSGPTKAIDN